jgi:hypothetical protein
MGHSRLGRASNKKRLGQEIPTASLYRYGTVDWLFREYKSSKAYLEKVSKRSRPDYERTMLLVADMPTKKSDRVGSRPVRSITPRGADKIYEKIRWAERQTTAPGREGRSLVPKGVECRTATVPGRI